MSNNLRIRGSVTISTPQHKLIVQDILDFLSSLEKLGVPITAEIPDGFLHFEWFSNNVDVIQCGEHLADEANKFDFVINAHDCEKESNTD
jgi:hypothetical protein